LSEGLREEGDFLDKGEKKGEQEFTWVGGEIRARTMDQSCREKSKAVGWWLSLSVNWEENWS